MVVNESERVQEYDAAAQRVRVVETDSLLATELEHAEGHWGRFRGLMLSKSLPAGAGLAIPGCSSIHMMFMRYAIDAVFYDQEARVTRIARGVRPWVGLGWGGRGATGVIELPAGAAADVHPGQQLEFLR